MRYDHGDGPVRSLFLGPVQEPRAQDTGFVVVGVEQYEQSPTIPDPASHEFDGALQFELLDELSSGDPIGRQNLRLNRGRQVLKDSTDEKRQGLDFTMPFNDETELHQRSRSQSCICLASGTASRSGTNWLAFSSSPAV